MLLSPFGSGSSPVICGGLSVSEPGCDGGVIGVVVSTPVPGVPVPVLVPVPDGNCVTTGCFLPLLQPVEPKTNPTATTKDIIKFIFFIFIFDYGFLYSFVNGVKQ
jgi:hypothetical protein